jgi:O-methyltransferase involved in polyketide biosynthesis
MSFQPPLELLEESERIGRQFAERDARASGTPFTSFFSPTEILQLARSSGFKSARQVSAQMLNERKFADTSDALRTTNGEEILVANT